MYKCREYGFLLSDNNELLTEIQFNEVASNIREFCFSIAAKTTTYDEKHPLALAMNLKGHLDVTVYSDTAVTYFGIYDSSKKEILASIDVSEFKAGTVWFNRFLGRCEHRIIERNNGNIDATILPEILGAWEKQFRTIGKELSTNVPCREYEVVIDPTPHFIEPDFESREDWDRDIGDER